MNNLPVSITRINEVQRVDANGKPQPMISVTWKAGDHGPFVHEFPRAGFNPQAAKNELAQFAAGLSQLSS
jgi:hypothetical protein